MVHGLKQTKHYSADRFVDHTDLNTKGWDGRGESTHYQLMCFIIFPNTNKAGHLVENAPPPPPPSVLSNTGSHSFTVSILGDTQNTGPMNIQWSYQP